MVLKIGHRGLKGYGNENKLISIQLAINNNMDAIEIDIRKTSDDSIVLFHDYSIYFDNKYHIIHETNYQIIKNYVQTLSFILSNIEVNSIKIFFDIKKCNNDEYFLYKFLNIIQHFIKKGWDNKLFYFQSFYSPYIKTLSDFNNLVINYGIIYHGLPLNQYKDCKLLNCTYICLDFKSIGEKDIEYIKKNTNMKIYLFTINKKEYILKYNKFNIDGIISDYSHIFN